MSIFMIHKAVDKDKTLSLTTSESESENPDICLILSVIEIM